MAEQVYILKTLWYLLKEKTFNLTHQVTMNLFVVEIILPKKKNIIIGCIYRHPSSSLSIQDFNNNIMEPMLEKISLEKKCVPY